MLQDRRIGKFRVAIDMINRHPDNVRQLMARCIILRTEWFDYAYEIVYHAICSDFEALEPGRIVPLYAPIIHSTSGLIGWEKLE